MGYGVTAHIVREPVNATALKALPRGLKWRLYRDETAGAWLIDVHADERGAEYPFTQSPHMLERPTGGRSSTREIDAFYRALEKINLDIYASPGVAALNKHLSAALGQEVLSLAADDDGMDQVCISRDGALLLVEHSSEAHVTWTASGGVTVRALFSDDDEEEHDDGGSDPVDDVTRLPDEARDSLLHGLALRRAEEFLSGRRTFLDLGSFDCLERVPPPVAQGEGAGGSSSGGGGGFWPFGRKKER